jgi:hypothetical protein
VVNALQTLNGRPAMLTSSPGENSYRRQYVTGTKATICRVPVDHHRSDQRPAGLSRDDMSRMISAGFTRPTLLQSASVRLADKARDVGGANATD